MSEPYISISQINTYIRNIFEAEVMLQNICVYGEVSSYSVSGGNAYFNLKDESGMLACVLFGAGRFDAPKIGDMVLVRGSMSYYAKGGKLSFNAISIMPYGKGLLYEKFLALKAELESRGYFDLARKRTLPGRVKRIGVVSSETGAVIRDIIDVTHRRNNGIDIVLFPVKVQGLGADREIAMGIDFFSCYDDVEAGRVKWPMSVIRLSSRNKQSLVTLADKILKAGFIVIGDSVPKHGQPGHHGLIDGHKASP